MTAVSTGKLSELEKVIERGLATFVEVGNALMEIRDGRLYRESHATFEDYCRERWDMSRVHAHRMIESAAVMGSLLPIGNKPANESQARPLSRLDPEQQAEAWQTAVETAPNGKVTAAHVESVVKDFLPTAEATYQRQDPIKARLERDETHRGETPITPGVLYKHAQHYTADYTDSKGRAFHQLENPSHTNSIFWQDITRHLKKQKISYNESVLKVVIKQLITDQRPSNILHSSESSEWYTPAKYVDAAREVMGAIDLDPASCAYANKTVKASSIYTIKEDGLAQTWRGRVFLNPPYGKTGSDSNQGLWSDALIAAYEAGRIQEAILLVNATPGNKWFAPLWNFPVCFPDHRIHFYNESGNSGQATHSNCFVYMGNRPREFARVYRRFGVIVVKYES